MVDGCNKETVDSLSVVFLQHSTASKTPGQQMCIYTYVYVYI